MERSNISGMGIEQYRKWMKENVEDILLKNESDPVDEIFEGMSDKKLHVSSVNIDELKGVAL